MNDAAATQKVQRSSERDRTCFEGLAAGGKAANRATAELFDHYCGPFRGFLLASGVTASFVDEIIGDAFARLFMVRAHLPQVVQPAAYLWQILRSAHLDWARKRQRDARVFVDLQAASVEGTYEESEEFAGILEQLAVIEGDEPLRRDLLECVLRALEKLRQRDPERAAVIELAAVQGLDTRALAEAIQRSEGATRQFLSQSRAAFQRLAESLCGPVFEL